MDMPIAIHHIEQCAPGVPTSIVQAIVRTESGFNPLAINVNRGFKLARQPASRREAEIWAKWLIANGYNFDAGLMQINTSNWRKLGLTVENVFDPCENIRGGAKLFSENYNRAAATFGSSGISLHAALSAYNTGDFTSGIQNGYVSRVMQNELTAHTNTQEIPTLVTADRNSLGAKTNRAKKKTRTVQDTGEAPPFASPTAIDDFTTENLRPWNHEREPRDAPLSDNPISSISPRPKSSSGRIGPTMKTKRFYVASLLASFLWIACAGRPAIQPIVLGLGHYAGNSWATEGIG
jgi:type IV secretion system protein VirB1